MKTFQTISQQDLDRKAIDAADLRLDAERGAHLLDELALKWFVTGYRAGIAGEPPIDLWSTDHRAGYVCGVQEAAQIARQRVNAYQRKAARYANV